jgi:rod shape determining protein RodA
MPAGRVSFRAGPQIDVPLLLCVVAIATLGVVNLYSATSYYIGHPRAASLADLYVLQIYWIVVGVLFGVLAAAIDYRHFERLATVFYLAGLVLLGLVFVLASNVRGSTRWLEIKGAELTFQPSEFMKVLVVLVIAKHLHNDQKTEPRTLIDLAIPAGLAAIPAAAVMAQPDLGTALIYILTTLTMLAMLRVNTKTMFGLIATAGVGIPLLINYGLHDYQRLRIESYLNPNLHKTGAAWHAQQSQTAIGNGGVLGEGFMQGTQNQFGYVPDQHSDFPFAVFAEDWGFFGCIVLLALYGFLCIWSVHIASLAKDRFGAAVAIGVGALFFWHTIFNIGMVVGLLPVVGTTLPLFSYGGSSIVTMLVSLGLLMNVSMRK